MRILSLDQRSPDWLKWRQTGLGSSDAAAVVGLSPWTSCEALWQKKVSEYHGLGDVGEKRSNSAMRRGQRLEGVAASEYEKLLGWRPEPVCAVHDSYEWLKASLDGWVESEKICVEIKAPNRDDHREALSGRVPEKYIPQVHHLLLVSGARCLHYVSYSDYFDRHEQLAVVLVKPDAEVASWLFEAERVFWESVVNKKNPEHGEDGLSRARVTA